MRNHNLTFEEYGLLAGATDSGFSLAHKFGLAGEVGELFEIWKRIERGDYQPVEETMILDELGDILWYVAAIARDYGYTLQEVADYNIQKLRARYPDGWSVEDSINRREYLHG